MRQVFACTLACGALIAGSAGIASAAPIIAPVAAVINAGGLGTNNIADTFNQEGLLAGYIPGITDFNGYFATDPLHRSNVINNAGDFVNEWFSDLDQTTATVTYDLGSVLNVGQMALWNEESSGAGMVDLLYSINNIDFFSLGQFVPTDNSALPPDPNTPSYLADVFAFGPVDARYVRLAMSGCGLQPGADNDYNACAIGEVAFSAPVPEPGTMLLLGSGLAAAAVRRRFRKRA